MSRTAQVYTRDGVEEYEELETAVNADGETWIHVDDIEQADVADLIEQLAIHRLAIENVGDPQSRPKTQQYETHTYVLLKTARLSRRDVEFKQEVHTTPIGFFIGDGWLLTMTSAESAIIDRLARQWTENPRLVSERGTDFLAYRMMDAIVDEYFVLLDDVEDAIEASEERVLVEPNPELLEELNGIRRDLLAFRKVAWPAREAIASLTRGEFPQVAERNEKYYRDVYDHLVQVVDLIETYRDLTRGSRDIYLNAVSQSTNEVMRTLTVVATIFIPLTFVVGVYGMNFAGTPLSMPELVWPTSYPATMLGMAAMAALMLVHFRRQQWL